MKKRIITMLLATTLAISLLSGCGTKEPTPNTETSQTENTTENLTEVTDETEVVEDVTETTEQPTTQETEQTEEPTETPAPTYTYTNLDKTMFAKQSVNVRSLPTTDGEKLGALTFAQEIKVTGQCNETKWYRIDYNGNVGYVSNNYLVDEKPVAQTTPSTNNDNGGSNGGTTSNSGGDRYGGSWDYVGDPDWTYTGATLYTNTTYGTSFTVPSTARIWGYRMSQITNSTRPVQLTQAAIDDAGVTITLCFSKGGNNETEALEIEKSDLAIGGWTSGETYTTTIGGNTYYCCEVTSPNGVSNKLFLARQSNGKIIVYVVMSNSVKVTTDIAKQYILY